MKGEVLTYKKYYEFYSEQLVLAQASIRNKLKEAKKKLEFILAIKCKDRRPFKNELLYLKERVRKLEGTLKVVNRLTMNQQRYIKYFKAIFLESELALTEGYTIDTRTKLGTLKIFRFLSTPYDKEAGGKRFSSVDWPNTIRNRIALEKSGVKVEDFMSYKNPKGIEYLKFRDEQPCWYYIKIIYKKHRDRRFFWYTFTPYMPKLITEDSLFGRLRDLSRCVSCDDETIFKTRNKRRLDYGEAHSDILNKLKEYE